MVLNSQELQTLRRFKDLSSHKQNHKQLISDKKALLYPATLLESRNPDILHLCLDIFQNFLDNEDTHGSLISTFGIYEALDALSIRTRNVDETISKRAAEFTEILRESAPPAYRTRSRARGSKNPPVYLLYVPELTPQSKALFEGALVKTRGLISFLIDLEAKRCTLRLSPKTTLKEVIRKILEKSELKCLIVRKNKQDSTEAYYDVTTPHCMDGTYLEYSQEEFLHKSGAVARAQGPAPKGAPGFLGSVRHFWNESFYW